MNLFNGSVALKPYPYEIMTTAALTLVEIFGWSVFPCPVGEKKSHKSREFSDGRNWGATRDPDEILRDFSPFTFSSDPRYVPNIGVPCGPDNGFWVTEADTLVGHGVDGHASLRQLEDQYGKLPETLQAESPSGSLHYYFKWPIGIEIRNSTSAIAPGVDVRGNGGMVVAPPSIKPSGAAYRWRRRVPMADAPQWLLDLAAPQRREQHSSSSFMPTAAPEKIRAALSVVMACSRTERLAVLCGLYKELGSAGLAVAEAWAGGRYNVKRTWDSITKANGYGWSIGTLFWLANQRDPDWEEEMKHRWKAEQLNDVAEEDERLSAIDWAASKLLRRRVDPALALILLTSFNQVHCRPPLEESEVVEIFDYRIKGRE